MAINTPGGARVTLVTVLGSGQIANNVLHFENLGGWTSGSLTEIADAVAAIWGDSAFGAYVSASAIRKEVIAASLEAGAPPSALHTVNAAGLQTSSPVLPANVSLAIKLSTALSGRSFRGRLYHPTLMESWVTGDIVDGGVRDGLVEQYSRFLGIYGVSTPYSWSVLSKQIHNDPRFEGVLTNVTAVSADNVVDSQRRRLLGRGR